MVIEREREGISYIQIFLSLHTPLILGYQIFHLKIDFMILNPDWRMIVCVDTSLCRHAID